ncbi:Nucleoside recognition domain protein (Part 2) [Syntrophaceticus schinkii]|jgi:hypothetical protein|uniref:Nucleoside recognition domain protein (Part 2) n=1 Tax=Syntrophaceticus schinkii TaxID=499207 RepID=A0A0B7MS18_9FIRM|nr:Nucleoside recognition domain protein (Part 2) [Syntrophaceticus schinkii]
MCCICHSIPIESAVNRNHLPSPGRDNFRSCLRIGLIIQSVKAGEISSQENYLLNIFLSICHGMIEDTLLFVAIGANLGVLVAVRVAAAVLITRLFACYINRQSDSQSINV